jgi:DNA repair protein RecO (recombination protein O)
MIESATGLILRTRPLTETSLIVHWLTADFGRVAMVAKGARRARSPFAGKLDLFYLADFSFSRSRRSDLHTLRETQLLETHAAIREDINKLRQAAYATSILEQVTETETPLPAIYGLMCGFLDCLCRKKAAQQLIFALELKLLKELGLAPNLAESSLSAGTKKAAGMLARHDWAGGMRLKLTGAQATELRQFLHDFLIFHLGRLPGGRMAALAETA